jgi:SAM-dependent methyltransferase
MSLLHSIKHWFENISTSRKTPDQLHEYWKHPDDGRNQIPGYIAHVERSEFLFSYIKKYADPESKILEIGCNVGRNLNYLFEQGYQKLEGIEISEEAIEAMKKTYPDMAKLISVHQNSVEEIIKTFADNSFDMVFTLAVFMHLHFESEWVFKEVARITKRYLITVEDEEKIFWRHFPRNYKKIFEKLGFRQIQEYRAGQAEGLTPNYWLRVFVKNQ